MTDAPQIHAYITDAVFKEAVALIDAGDVDALAALLDQHPRLLSEAANFSETFFISGTQPDQYFEHPKLLWFTAENPIRNSAFPDNIVDVIQCIIDRQRKHAADTLQDDLDYTLALVTSGNVPRETGKLTELVAVLVKNGADPNCAEAALAHGERDAVQALLDAGAEVDLLIAAGMGLEDDLQRLLPDADAETKQKALACAANCGQPVTSRMLIEKGADPNQFNPDGFHAHCTPLHSAISADSYETVAALIDCGADPTIKDRIHDGDALGWANHMAREQMAELIKAAL